MSLINNPNSNEISDHSTQLLVFLEKIFLSTLTKQSVYDNFASKTTLGSRMGKSYTWHRWDNIAEDTPTITEGVNPDGIKLVSNPIVKELAQYGKVVAVTDLMEATGIASVMEAAGIRLADHARLLQDRLYRDEIINNGTQAFAAGLANEAAVQADPTAVLTSEEIRTATKNLKSRSVPKFEDGKYVGIIHPCNEFDLLGEASANTAIQLTSNVEQGRTVNGEMGTIYGSRIVVSDNVTGKDTVTNPNVFVTSFFGKDAYAGVKHESMGLELIRKEKESGGVANPLNLFGTVGYKMYFGAKTLEDARIENVNVYTA